MTQEDLQRQVAQRRAHSRSMSIPQVPQQQQHQPQQQHHGLPSPQPNLNSMNLNDVMSGGDSLDDIIENNDELQRQRRQSYSQNFAPETYSPGNFPSDNDRRSSMLAFANNNSSMSGFQFNTPTSAADNQILRRQSTGEMDLDMYGGMGAGMHMPMSQMGYSNSVQPNIMAMDPSVAYPAFTEDMVPGMMTYSSMGMEGMSTDSPLDMYSNQNYSPTVYVNDPMQGMESMGQDFFMRNQDSMRMRNIGDENNQMIPSRPDVMDQSPNNMGISRSVVDYNSPSTSNAPPNALSRASSTTMLPTTLSKPVATTATAQAPPTIYSSTGFDMLGALMRVVGRKNKVIEIGAVDLSCAFVVCDLREADCPIIYVSDVFERLTGYSKHEVLGRNCRFLQSPEGRIQQGERRMDTENNKVYELKKAIDNKTETQQAIINYRKGGQPFMNLLTMIPIPADDNDPGLSLVVGFQVDVVANPNSVLGSTDGGNYSMTYKQGTLPRYIWHPPQPDTQLVDGSQTISRDDVSSVLASYDNGNDPELTKRMWDKMILENTDDVIHVLSLKGLFMYLSPSCLKVLEYDSSELIGTALSSVCHPSDIVPVTRELKETSQGNPVNVVFRIRRKTSGYTWFESHGSLCVEQGKGRKCIIMVGRERPVYALARNDLNRSEGYGDNELFSKISTSGMFLFVSSSVRASLERTPDELIGTSIQSLMRPDSKVEFGRALEKARTGKIVSYRHEALNKRGLVLQAETTLYPGDAPDGHKPTFLLAQTRFAKAKGSSRPVATATRSNGTTLPGSKSMIINPMSTTDAQSPAGTPLNNPSSQSQLLTEILTPGSTNSGGPITQSGGNGLPIGSQDEALASEDNIFDELKTTRCTSWQYELRQMEKTNRLLGEELAQLLNAKKKRKRRKVPGRKNKDCVNCHTKDTPEWRRGPSGERDLCNSCGLRYAKMVSLGGSETTLTPGQTVDPSSSSTS